MIRYMSHRGYPGSSDSVTTINEGREVAAPDIVGIWNNLYPDVSAALKKNVVGIISQVGVNSDVHSCCVSVLPWPYYYFNLFHHSYSNLL